MKSIAFFLLATLGIGALSAQKLNDKGLYVTYDEKSAMLVNDNLFNGVVSETKDGVRAELTIKDGVVDGPARYFSAAGQLIETGSFTNGQKDQKWVRYNQSGTISAIAFYALGKKTGTWLVYDDQGKKRFEMNYADGQKTGIWTSWDENGMVVSSKDYSQVN